MVSTGLNKIKTRSFECPSGFKWVQIGLLLLALLLPGAARSVFESATSFGAESESSCEVDKECMPLTEARRLRKGRSGQPCWLGDPISSAQRTIVSARQFDGHGIEGHRIRNGLLAPLRC